MYIPTVWERKYALIVEIAEFTVKTKCTCRQSAKIFGISKSAVHRYLTKVLPTFDKDLADQVTKVLQENKRDRHNRGGEAHRLKCLYTKQSLRRK